MTSCAFDGCPNQKSDHAGFGLCAAHYQQQKRTGALGPLRSELSAEERFWEKVDTTGTCWLWTAATDRHGYGRFHLASSDAFYAPSGALKQVGAHQYAYALDTGAWPEALVLHHCDVRNCVRPTHLYAGSTADNSRDRIDRGPASRGEAYEKAKLTVQDVRDLRSGRRTPESVADMRGVQTQTAEHARDRITWKWLDPEGGQ